MVIQQSEDLAYQFLPFLVITVCLSKITVLHHAMTSSQVNPKFFLILIFPNSVVWIRSLFSNKASISFFINPEYDKESMGSVLTNLANHAVYHIPNNHTMQEHDAFGIHSP